MLLIHEIEKEIRLLSKDKSLRRCLFYLYSHRYGNMFDTQVDRFSIDGIHIIQNDNIKILDKYPHPVNEVQKAIHDWWLDETFQEVTRVKSTMFSGKEQFTEELEDTDAVPDGLWYIFFEIIPNTLITIKTMFWKAECATKPKRGTAYIKSLKEVKIV